MARRKRRTEQQERQRLAYYSAKFPGDMSVAEQNEFEALKQKYG